MNLMVKSIGRLVDCSSRSFERECLKGMRDLAQEDEIEEEKDAQQEYAREKYTLKINTRSTAI